MLIVNGPGGNNGLLPYSAQTRLESARAESCGAGAGVQRDEGAEAKVGSGGRHAFQGYEDVDEYDRAARAGAPGLRGAGIGRPNAVGVVRRVECRDLVVRAVPESPLGEGERWRRGSWGGSPRRGCTRLLERSRPPIKIRSTCGRIMSIVGDWPATRAATTAIGALSIGARNTHEHAYLHCL